eukprot:CAMPEP_0118850396 /NCGR_PEP_ID=MMETSP1163-20130328/273_1 /TAXON_ID=124430 /ORGANISM="Phaeomonas parva, Strain CCMP2877" /LENGTH=1814 /DNA_ID=CAMNT_0006782605 /DNA_START=208 /DNA_END=5652 /DNA_ORIENTATION=+
MDDDTVTPLGQAAAPEPGSGHDRRSVHFAEGRASGGDGGPVLRERLPTAPLELGDPSEATPQGEEKLEEAAPARAKLRSEETKQRHRRRGTSLVHSLAPPAVDRLAQASEARQQDEDEYDNLAIANYYLRSKFMYGVVLPAVVCVLIVLCNVGMWYAARSCAEAYQDSLTASSSYMEWLRDLGDDMRVGIRNVTEEIVETADIAQELQAEYDALSPQVELCSDPIDSPENRYTYYSELRAAFEGVQAQVDGAFDRVYNILNGISTACDEVPAIFLSNPIYNYPEQFCIYTRREVLAIQALVEAFDDLLASIFAIIDDALDFYQTATGVTGTVDSYCAGVQGTYYDAVDDIDDLTAYIMEAAEIIADFVDEGNTVLDFADDGLSAAIWATEEYVNYDLYLAFTLFFYLCMAFSLVAVLIPAVPDDKPDLYAERLYVQVKEASGLSGRDEQGRSDPYALVSVLPHRPNKPPFVHETYVERGTTNPYWNTTFHWYLPRNHNFEEVCVQIFDADWNHEDDYMGELSVPLVDLDGGGVGSSPPEKQEDEDGAGARLSLGSMYGSFQPRTFEPHWHPLENVDHPLEMVTGALKVHVYKMPPLAESPYFRGHAWLWQRLADICLSDASRRVIYIALYALNVCLVVMCLISLSIGILVSRFPNVETCYSFTSIADTSRDAIELLITMNPDVAAYFVSPATQNETMALDEDPNFKCEVLDDENFRVSQAFLLTCAIGALITQHAVFLILSWKFGDLKKYRYKRQGHHKGVLKWIFGSSFGVIYVLSYPFIVLFSVLKYMLDLVKAFLSCWINLISCIAQLFALAVAACCKACSMVCLLCDTFACKICNFSSMVLPRLGAAIGAAVGTAYCCAGRDSDDEAKAAATNNWLRRVSWLTSFMRLAFRKARVSVLLLSTLIGTVCAGVGLFYTLTDLIHVAEMANPHLSFWVVAIKDLENATFTADYNLEGEYSDFIMNADNYTVELGFLANACEDTNDYVTSTSAVATELRDLVDVFTAPYFEALDEACDTVGFGLDVYDMTVDTFDSELSGDILAPTAYFNAPLQLCIVAQSLVDAANSTKNAYHDFAVDVLDALALPCPAVQDAYDGECSRVEDLEATEGANAVSEAETQNGVCVFTINLLAEVYDTAETLLADLEMYLSSVYATLVQVDQTVEVAIEPPMELGTLIALLFCCTGLYSLFILVAPEIKNTGAGRSKEHICVRVVRAIDVIDAADASAELEAVTFERAETPTPKADPEMKDDDDAADDRVTSTIFGGAKNVSMWVGATAKATGAAAMTTGATAMTQVGTYIHSFADPYCMIYYGNSRQRSRTTSLKAEPEFGELFKFGVPNKDGEVEIPDVAHADAVEAEEAEPAAKEADPGDAAPASSPDGSEESALPRNGSEESASSSSTRKRASRVSSLLGNVGRAFSRPPAPLQADLTCVRVALFARSFFARDTFLGEVTIPLGEIPLRDRYGQEKPEPRVLMLSASTAYPEDQQIRGALELEVYREERRRWCCCAGFGPGLEECFDRFYHEVKNAALVCLKRTSALLLLWGLNVLITLFYLVLFIMALFFFIVPFGPSCNGMQGLLNSLYRYMDDVDNADGGALTVMVFSNSTRVVLADLDEAALDCGRLEDGRFLAFTALLFWGAAALLLSAYLTFGVLYERYRLDNPLRWLRELQDKLRLSYEGYKQRHAAEIADEQAAAVAQAQAQDPALVAQPIEGLESLEAALALQHQLREVLIADLKSAADPELPPNPKSPFRVSTFSRRGTSSRAPGGGGGGGGAYAFGEEDLGEFRSSLVEVELPPSAASLAAPRKRVIKYR